MGVLLGNGDGSFQTAVTYSSGGYAPVSVAVADVNGDGKPDIVVVNACADINCTIGRGSLGVLLGNGDGTFQTVVNFDSGGNQAYTVAVTDVNGDGKPDIVVANRCMDSKCSTNGSVGVLLGNGDGTFQTAVTYSSGGYQTASVAVADVNGDGKPDLLVANSCVDSTCATNGTVGVLLGNGDGTFQPVVTFDSGGLEAESVAVADINGDGKPDIVVANEASNNVGVLLGNGDGTLQTALTYATLGRLVVAVAVADVNGDGEPDIVVANQCGNNTTCNTGAEDGSVGVLLGNGDGTFRPVVNFDSGGYASTSVAVADVNGDGKPDILVTNFCGNTTTCGTNGTVGVLINISTVPYKAFVQPPINADGSSIFNAKRGVIPVKFTLTQNGTQTCALPPATISVTRTAGGTEGPIDEASYLSPADNGSNFRITDCQYIYNLASNSLGVGAYRVDISINGQVVGSGSFALK